jgi:hypothetical protein
MDGELLTDAELAAAIAATPTLWIDNIDEMLMIHADIDAWEAGEITADDFKDMWGDFHPDGDWLIGLRPTE